MIDKTLNYIILYGIPIVVDIVNVVAVQKRLTPQIMENTENVGRSLWETIDMCQPCNLVGSFSPENFSYLDSLWKSNQYGPLDYIIHCTVGFYSPQHALILQTPSLTIYYNRNPLLETPYKTVELKSTYTEIVVEKTYKRITDHQLQPIFSLINR